ncbi:hypothetical protein OSB04_003122 [Centaurea solstitialis]|uniref:Integrase catalytic domain-containing protein n=1 Tax=Centaurea solstitialis TaxID=347529 RepID=A0AA38WVK6_9ASTR|nr:hypothetical protein OSB04_003122 [Centaurea solstitialis]
MLKGIDPWAGCTNRAPLISEIRSTKPNLTLDPNIVYDVKVFLDPEDDPSSYIPRKIVKPNTILPKSKSSTEFHASDSEKNKPEGAKSVGTDREKSNAFDAFRNDMCFMFDNFLRNGVANSFNAFNSNVNYQKRKGKKKGKTNPSPSVKSPTPMEKSKRGTTPKTSVVANPKVKKLRSDNGTKFRNAKLQSFLEDVGISHNFSAVRTPQQNGIVERKNRTLVEAARSMMAHSSVPQSLWAEAVSTACFIQNWTLIIKRTGKTAYEMIKKRKPNIDFFNVFGCKCYVLNDRDDLDKFDPKSDESTFIGYSLKSVTYRVYHKCTRSILESPNVDFSESETYSDACSSSSTAFIPELCTTTPSIAFAPNTFALDFIDPADYDLPTLTAPIIVAIEPDCSSTLVSSDAFVTESSSVPTVDGETSTETVT